MTTEHIVYLVSGGVLLIGILVAYLTGSDYLKYSRLIKPILKAVIGVLQAVGGIFPENKILGEVITVISTSVKAAGYAEDLWLQGEINKKDRPRCAKEYITKILSSAGLEVTESISTIISGVIAITCYLMPHYKEVEVIEETETEE